jgi:protein involved in polysaccharide export with SLBB domain
MRKAAEAKLGRNVTQAEVISRLKSSGMSREEVRARLQLAGYDPKLADQYFDIIEKGGTPPSGMAADTTLLALSRIGAAPAAGWSSIRDTSRFSNRNTRNSKNARRLPGDTIAGDSISGDSLDYNEPDTLEVFGLRVFRNTSTMFEPLVTGPVDPSYRLGPGDELTLVLTGDVEAVYPLTVTREGQLFIPSVGQVTVNNLTLAELRDILYSRLGRIYSGISRGADATERFQVSIGQLRTNQIFIAGDVAAPGSYQVSSVAGLFNALYQAGGPTAQGSFRRVQLWRGGKMIHAVDLYDFLVAGDGSSDFRLEQNDRIFVPPAGVQVRIDGAVRRPAIYEMLPNETVADALRFAGGLAARAMGRHIQIDRILPPAQQTPGHYRTIVDVDAANPTGPLYDGDELMVFEVTDRRRNMVTLTGEVHAPGLYEWTPGATLWSLVNRADGLGETAYTQRAHIYRLIESNGARQLIQATLERDAAGQPTRDIPLADGDSIVIFSRADLRTDESVTIDGLVKQPDTYAFATGMTLKDLVLAAKGFLPGASVLEAEVSRQPDPTQRTSRTALVYRVQLQVDTTITTSADGSANRYTQALVPVWPPVSNEFQLQNGDHVYIRQAPGYTAERTVSVVGEVNAPGSYTLQTRSERLTDLIARAKSLTPEAYIPGIHVVRDGVTVAANLQKGLRDTDNQNNILLQDGDSIIVPPLQQMVKITGAVVFETSAIYTPGKDLMWYVEQAGGATRKADKSRITITYPSGARRVRHTGLFRSGNLPVEPGSEITVPIKPEGATGPDWGSIITRLTAVIGTVATLLIAVNQTK